MHHSSPFCHIHSHCSQCLHSTVNHHLTADCIPHHPSRLPASTTVPCHSLWRSAQRQPARQSKSPTHSPPLRGAPCTAQVQPTHASSSTPSPSLSLTFAVVSAGVPAPLRPPPPPPVPRAHFLRQPVFFQAFEQTRRRRGREGERVATSLQGR